MKFCQPPEKKKLTDSFGSKGKYSCCSSHEDVKQTRPWSIDLWQIVNC